MLSGDHEAFSDVALALVRALEPSYAHLVADLYTRDLLSLGHRICGTVFQLFREHNGWARNTIAKVLMVTAGEDVCKFVKLLLEDPDPKEQFKGLRLAGLHPCPSLIDKLWDIHKCGMKSPFLFLEEGDQEWQFHYQSWPAFLLASKAEPSWVIQKVLQSDKDQDPIHELAWSIFNLDDGLIAWQQTSSTFFEKLGPDKYRVLAVCVGRFRDKERQEWLEQQIRPDTKTVAPVALQALSRIHPTRAADLVRRVDHLELRMCKRWSFREVWHRCPEHLNANLLTWSKEVPDPWEFGLLFEDRAIDIPIKLLDILLIRLEKKLLVVLHSNEKEQNTHLYPELTIVASAVDPSQLALLNSRKDSSFEESLAQYVRRIGPQVGRYNTGYERNSALTILQRINGSHFISVINDFLLLSDGIGRHDSLKWACLAPDEKTFQIVSSFIGSSELYNDFPLIQFESMRLLALHGQWERAAQGFLRWELHTPADVTEERIVPRDYSAPWIDELRESLQKEATAGKVIAIGFAGNGSDIFVLHEILRLADAEGSLAHSCVIGLRLLEDDSDAGCLLVGRQLSINGHRHSATHYLTTIGSTLAWKLLWEDLQQSFDHINALNLMNLSQYADLVVNHVSANLQKSSRFGEDEFLRILVRKLRSPYKERLLEDRWLRDRFHRSAVEDEGRSWIVGSKVAAIQCLSEFDKTSAYQATLLALRKPEWHDRERYPYLLYELDPKSAIPHLLAQLVTEPGEHVRYAIGRVMSNERLHAKLELMLESSAATVRQSACFAAGWALDNYDCVGLLTRALEDQNPKVISAAMDSLDRIRDQAVRERLIEVAIATPDISLKWTYLQAASELGDPGDVGRPIPQRVSQVCDGLTSLHRSRINKLMQDRRKKVLDELKKVKRDD
ncbi:MAG: hypothetical protein JWM11_5170 [Planctomycetaceae bacterium]|nr:hypothetical protein [Planctomycetaceae bacterium]